MAKRYWVLNAIYYAHHDGVREGHDRANVNWQRAAREKRIKTRKQRGSNSIKVWIETKIEPAKQVIG